MADIRPSISLFQYYFHVDSIPLFLFVWTYSYYKSLPEVKQTIKGRFDIFLKLSWKY